VTLSWGSTPLQSTTGVHRPIGFRRFPASSRPRIGSASPGVLRPYGACAPWRHPSAAAGVTRSRESEERHLLARFRPRAFTTPRRFRPPAGTRPGCPDRALRRTLPGSFAALFHAANALGIFPAEPSPPEKPCRLPTALASLRVRAQARLRRDGFEDLATGFPRAPTSCRVPAPVKARSARRRSRGRELPRPSGRPSTTRLPEWLLRRPLVPVGLAGSWPGRPLRSFAPLGSPFAREPFVRPSFRPCARPAPGPLLSWD
jgi:hypothetical protein